MTVDKQYTEEALMLMARLNREKIDFKGEAEFPRAEFNREGKQKGFLTDVMLLAVPMVIEAKGGIHLKWKVEEYDLKREEWFRNRGYFVLSFTNFALRHHMDDCMATIRTEYNRLMLERVKA